MAGMQELQFVEPIHRVHQIASLEQTNEIRAAPHRHVLAVVNFLARLLVTKRSSPPTEEAFCLKQRDVEVVTKISGNRFSRRQSSQTSTNDDHPFLQELLSL